jgi:hypothetical protein
MLHVISSARLFDDPGIPHSRNFADLHDNVQGIREIETESAFGVGEAEALQRWPLRVLSMIMASPLYTQSENRSNNSHLLILTPFNLIDFS